MQFPDPQLFFNFIAGTVAADHHVWALTVGQSENGMNNSKYGSSTKQANDLE